MTRFFSYALALVAVMIFAAGNAKAQFPDAPPGCTAEQASYCAEIVQGCVYGYNGLCFPSRYGSGTECGCAQVPSGYSQGQCTAEQAAECLQDGGCVYGYNGLCFPSRYGNGVECRCAPVPPGFDGHF